MDPVQTITPSDWMTDPALRSVFAALQDGGTAPQVLLVGGCVRNTVLGIPPGDIDLATVHAPDEVVRRLNATGLRSVPTGIDHGTVTAIADGRPFEITTLRRDVETDGRRAVVAFTTDWNIDAQRRDFTMNTLLMDGSGRIYDPLRCGIADLQVGRVVFVGDPAARIAEDILRILRFFRFHAFYGRGEADAAALAACKNRAFDIHTLSRERITAEVLKILMAPDPVAVLELMFDNNVLPMLAHAEYKPGALRSLAGIQKRCGSELVESRLVILCAGHAQHLATLENFLLLSRVQQQRVETLCQSLTSPAGLRERLYRYGRDMALQSVLLLAAMHDAVLSTDDIATLRDSDIPVFPLNGDHLKSLGIPPGPAMGAILRAVETWWIEWDFQPALDQCMERARLELED